MHGTGKARSMCDSVEAPGEAAPDFFEAIGTTRSDGLRFDSHTRRQAGTAS